MGLATIELVLLVKYQVTQLVRVPLFRDASEVGPAYRVQNDTAVLASATNLDPVVGYWSGRRWLSCLPATVNEKVPKSSYVYTPRRQAIYLGTAVFLG